jgi:hypothetical protein
VFAFALATLFVVFLAQVSTHSHEKGQSDTTCQICQAAHLGPILPSGILSVHVALQSAGCVEPFVAAFHQEFFLHDSPSRAPPSLFL